MTASAVTASAGLRVVADRGDDAPPTPKDFGPIRPAVLSVWPSEDGYFGIDVCWRGRECVLRAVVVRRMLADAGLNAEAGNSLDGRTWELKVSRVPGDRVGKVIETIIW